MALKNEEFEKFRRIYEERQRENEYALRARREEVYSRIPEYRELERRIADLSMECSRALIELEDPEAREERLKQLRSDISQLREKKSSLLAEHGYAADHLKLHYHCEKCRDTGFIDGEKCSCFKQLELEPLYEASRIRDILRENNFSLLRRDYYSGEDLKAFDTAVAACKNFISDFDTDYQNLLFYGTVGSGKSFLSDCVADELLKSGHSIIYFSAEQLFKSVYAVANERNREKQDSFYERLFGSDLLIIDDLGTELTNDFTLSQLFHILNERGLNRRSYIISTNLDLEQIRQRYSDRLFSRLMENCTICRLSGRDIRLQRKIEKTYQSA
ncbi:MAG: ATP-binding protein [Lachnospiraceae bacterium]|nr:ATP-binding protein [Lachnospiraceae bacterium]